MKNHFRTFITRLILLAAAAMLPLMLPSCAPEGSTATTGSQTTEEQTFTLEQLAEYDGQNGNRAYIAVDGIVYDVTDVKVWDGKPHAGQFAAGKDYTEELKKAPHSAKMLEQAKIVGKLVN